MKIFNIASLLFISVVLTGCASSSLQGTTPDEVAISALRRNMAARKYQFEGKVLFSDINLHPAAQNQAKAQSLKQWLDKLSRAFSLNINGAIDLEKRLIELTPALHVKHRNLKSHMAFPLLIDAKAVQAYLDASALALFDSTGSVPHGKYVHFHLPPHYLDKVKNLDFEHFCRTIERSTLNAYTNINKNAYSFIPLSPEDRQHGAVRKIRLTLSAEEAEQLSSHTLGGIIKALSAFISPLVEHNGERKEGVKTWYDQLVLLTAGTFKQKHTQNMQLDFALNRKGDIVTLTESIRVVVPNFATAKIVFKARLFNYGNPTFTIHPTVEGSVDFKKLSIPPLLENVLAGKIFTHAAMEENAMSSMKKPSHLKKHRRK
jgi:hypothetical protein